MQIIQDQIMERYHKKRQLLFIPSDGVIQYVSNELNQLTRKQGISWALVSAQMTIDRTNLLNEFQSCLDAARLWSMGKIKMKTAQREIMKTHKIASSFTDKPLELLGHGIAQAASTVHSQKHAIGLVMYEMSAIFYQHGPENGEAFLHDLLATYFETMESVRQKLLHTEWARFIEKKELLQ